MEIEAGRWRVGLWPAHFGCDEGRGCKKNRVTRYSLYLAGTIQRYDKVPSHKGTEKNGGKNTNISSTSSPCVFVLVTIKKEREPHFAFVLSGDNKIQFVR